ncbi:Sugar-specific transcriptional regulator TrmB [Saccharomonospora cyanea NA-134]|uniref:Sugar-specific transcriptional regulator TrmB n=1 Tax=Saccharomonospora cyanea NA-134 TaxID=882082 RepID=H5XEY4_9PSEU|nr:Sugar-specific transcriptional regulator TrmB [Saccharomonospora cyanea NA-134]
MNVRRAVLKAIADGSWYSYPEVRDYVAAEQGVPRDQVYRTIRGMYRKGVIERHGWPLPFDAEEDVRLIRLATPTRSTGGRS